MLDSLAADAKEQGLKPDPGCLRDGFLCVEGDRAFVKLLLATEDLDAHGKRFLALIQAGRASSWGGCSHERYGRDDDLAAAWARLENQGVRSGVPVNALLTWV